MSISRDCEDGAIHLVRFIDHTFNYHSLYSKNCSAVPCYLGGRRACRTVRDSFSVDILRFSCNSCMKRHLRQGVLGLHPPTSLVTPSIRHDRLCIFTSGCLVALFWRFWCTCLDTRGCRIRSFCFARVWGCVVEWCERWRTRRI
jgi:hypothetical protein